MRSRASGGICGDSVAAASAETMSSLRRRAIWITRARSIERSSIGGRASARTDRAGVAGVDQQPQPGEHVAHLGALEEGGRPDHPVGHRALLQRAGHELALAADRAHEHSDALGRDVVAPDQPLDVGGHALGLPALVGAAPEAHVAALVAVEGLAQAILVGRDHRAGRAQHVARTAEAVLERNHGRVGVTAAEVEHVLGGAAVAPHGLVVVGGGHQADAFAGQQFDQADRREARVLEVVDHHVPMAIGRPRAHLRPIAQQRARLHDHLARVEGSLLGQHPVVIEVELGELALAMGEAHRRAHPPPIPRRRSGLPPGQPRPGRSRPPSARTPRGR